MSIELPREVVSARRARLSTGSSGALRGERAARSALASSQGPRKALDRWRLFGAEGSRWSLRFHGVDARARGLREVFGLSRELSCSSADSTRDRSTGRDLDLPFGVGQVEPGSGTSGDGDTCSRRSAPSPLRRRGERTAACRALLREHATGEGSTDVPTEVHCRSPARREALRSQRARRRPGKTSKRSLRLEHEVPLVRPLGVERRAHVSTLRSRLPGAQKTLAEYSMSGQRAGEDTTSLRREDVARALNTAEDVRHGEPWS